MAKLRFDRIMLRQMLLPDVCCEIIGASVDGSGRIVLEVEGKDVPDSEEVRITRWSRSPTVIELKPA